MNPDARPIRLGVHSEDLHASARHSMEIAAKLAMPLIQLRAVDGEVSPQELSASGRRHVLRFARNMGLSIVALGAELSGHVTNSSTLDLEVARARRILELARDLDVAQVSAPVRVGAGMDTALLREAITQIAEHADRLDCPFAIETSADSPQDLCTWLEDINCDLLKVCYDPGSLMIAGRDPLAPIEALADRISLSHLRDAIVGSPGQPGRETALGQGQLNLPVYLQHLKDAGYHGPQMLRRAHGSQPVEDLTRARAYFQEHC